MPEYAQTMDDRARNQIAAWLLLCCIMIFAMVSLGGVTRLTGSGLSMVEWDPIFGWVPPLNDAEWEAVFAKYQDSPEYRHVNIGMDLHGFKSIYWFEFAHRLLGRSIGAVFLLPLIYFAARGMLTRGLTLRLALAFVLGGLQGVLGWYMVKSGLIDRPHVSQYRLTAHLGLALVIYGYLLWLLLDLLFPRSNSASATPPAAGRVAFALLGLIALTILSGGFVAGLKAGHAYNTFPLMGGQWLPPAGWMLEPGWRNLFENIATVQFDHRLLATLSLVAVLAFWLYIRRRQLTPSARVAANLLPIVAIVQVSLGIATLLLHVPVAVAATHQAGALTLLTVMIITVHRLHRN
jgi:cytochrome c oxidase assembly protein subunit 15